jgi:hypothetical protein
MSPVMMLEHVLTYLVHFFVMTTDVFNDDEAGAHFDLPLRFLAIIFYKLNSQHNTHKETHRVTS